MAKVKILDLAKEAGAAARRRRETIGHLRERWQDDKLFEAVYAGWRSVEVEPPPRAPMNEAFQERLF